jgi:hypothetical protein
LNNKKKDVVFSTGSLGQGFYNPIMATYAVLLKGKIVILSAL